MVDRALITCCPGAISLIAIVLFIAIPFSNASFSSVVQPGEEHCFSVRTLEDIRSRISGNFDILDDELLPDPVTVSLYDEKFATVWKSTPKTTEGTFSIFGLGRYTLCLENGIHKVGEEEVDAEERDTEGWDGMERNIGFAIRISPLQRGLEPEKEGPDEKRTEEIMSASEQLLEGFYTLMDHQGYLKDREALHRNLMEATFQSIVRWTFIEAFILLLVAACQIAYLKKFFEQRTYL